MRIAIVGAGVSGLTAAHLLARHHEVTVFEAEQRPGGHANTVTVEVSGQTQNLDTGFIVFNDRNYPNFERLLDQLGVSSQASNMSFGVSDERGRFEYASTSPVGVFATGSNAISPAFLRMLLELPRFQRAAERLLGSDDDTTSLREWLERQHFSSAFVERLIVPQVAAVWSADPQQMWSFPATFMARFFHNHGMLALRNRPRWRTVTGGSRRYVEAITRSLQSRLHLGAPVQAVSRGADSVQVTVRGEDPRHFDHVVIATHSDQALALLADPSDAEREILGAIPYQANEAVLHTDRSVLPKRRRAWASWNYHLLDEPSGRTAVTYHLNRLQSLAGDQEFCVTLNLSDRIASEKVLRRIGYSHPVYTPASVAAQRRRDEISGAGRSGRTHYCGAYWGWGFHEDGVVSGARVAEAFGETL
jgi:predicted NAD/FAD-binding protein